MRSSHVTVTIDLERVRANADAIRTRTQVPLIAVIKSDAYGLGAEPVAEALHEVATEFAYFSVDEAAVVRRPGLLIGPMQGADPQLCAALDVRPTVENESDARACARIPVTVNLDTGMQRFGCDLDRVRAIVAHGNVRDIFTHANSPAAARQLEQSCRPFGVPLHAAASALLDAPEAWLDAVRPGFALYDGAVRVATRLTHVRETLGGVGYTGVEAGRIGVFLAGYSHGVRPAPVVINGRRQRMLEVGMNTTIVSAHPDDRVDDEVLLLGPALAAQELASELHVRPHEVLCAYTSIGQREYRAVEQPTRLARKESAVSRQ